MRAMLREIGILVKEDLSNGIDYEALNLMINSISNLDINLYIDKTSNNKNEQFKCRFIVFRMFVTIAKKKHFV